MTGTDTTTTHTNLHLEDTHPHFVADALASAVSAMIAYGSDRAEIELISKLQVEAQIEAHTAFEEEQRGDHDAVKAERLRAVVRVAVAGEISSATRAMLGSKDSEIIEGVLNEGAAKRISAPAKAA